MEFDIALLANQGEREEMEDYSGFDVNFQNVGAVFGGVYDGHGGRQVAEYVAQEFPRRFAEIDGGRLDCSDSFLITYREIADAVCDRKMIGGVCLATFVIAGKKLFFANTGDARLLLIREKDFCQLSNDHRPSNPAEKARIERVGGKIERCRIIGEKTSIGFSRSIGDCEFRQFGLIADPHLGALGILPTDLMLIASSDGLFEYLDNESIRRLALEKNSAAEIALHLIRAGLQSGSQDNLSVIVVKFR